MIPMDLNQDTVYNSSRGDVMIEEMVVTHAQRALDKLVREHGETVRDTPLGRALADRAARDGEATDVDAIQGGSKMIRGRDGRFTGKWVAS